MKTRRRPTRRRGKSSPFTGAVRLAIVFAVLIALNVYVFFFKHGTSVADLQRLSADKELAATVIATPAKPKASPSSSLPSAAIGPKTGDKSSPPAAAAAVPGDVEVGAEDARIVSGTVGEGGSVAGLLKREGVPPKTAADLTATLARVFDVKQARAGHSYALRFDGEDRVRALEYRVSPTMLFRVDRTGAGAHEAYRAQKETGPLEIKVVSVGGTVEDSLFAAVKRAGEGTQLASALSDLLAGDIDLHAEAHASDTFRVLVEKHYLGDRFYRYGRILAAEYVSKAGTVRAFAWDRAGGAGVYDDKGESLDKTLLRAPLKLTRLAPVAGDKRFHPTPRTERGQPGVEYPAPAGTPVWATAPGKVTWKGNRGAGESVIVAHAGGMESQYLHLSRYAKGLEVGQNVRQKQVIGYVGATGNAPTGAYLHYSVKIGGHFTDPLRLKPARGTPLPAAERTAFLAAITPRMDQLAQLDVRPPRRALARAASGTSASAAPRTAQP